MDFVETDHLQLDNVPAVTFGWVLLVAPTADVQWFVWQDDEATKPNVFSHLEDSAPTFTLGDDCPQQEDDDAATWLPVYAPRLTLWSVYNFTTTATIYGCTNGTNVTHIGELLTTDLVANTINTSSVP